MEIYLLVPPGIVSQVAQVAKVLGYKLFRLIYLEVVGLVVQLVRCLVHKLDGPNF